MSIECPFCGAHPRHTIKVLVKGELRHTECLNCGGRFYPERWVDVRPIPPPSLWYEPANEELPSWTHYKETP